MKELRIHFELESGADPQAAMMAIQTAFTDRLPEVSVLKAEIPGHRSGNLQLAVDIVLHLLFAHEMIHLRAVLEEMRRVAEDLRRSNIPVKDPQLEVGFNKKIPVQDIGEEHFSEIEHS